MFNVEFENQNGDWAFRTFRTQQAADVFAKNAEMQGCKILFCGNPRDVLGEPTWESVTMDGRFSCDWLTQSDILPIKNKLGFGS